VEPISLTNLVEAQLAQARQSGNGRSACSIHKGHDRALHQTVLALVAGCELAEHESPGEATLQVLQGRVRLIAGDKAWDGTVGDYVTIPPERHSLAALEDAAVLLTVATPR
jgi:quercetin dioxygenase-like cupin family protein